MRSVAMHRLHALCARHSLLRIGRLGTQVEGQLDSTAFAENKAGGGYGASWKQLTLFHNGRFCPPPLRPHTLASTLTNAHERSPHGAHNGARTYERSHNSTHACARAHADWMAWVVLGSMAAPLATLAHPVLRWR